MPRIFVYEFITGGGLFSLEGTPPPSLLREGAAMASAALADVLSLGHEAVAMIDGRLDVSLPAGCTVHRVAGREEEERTFRRCTAHADKTLIVAPEFLHILEERAEWALAIGGHLLSPGPDLIRLTADKQATADHLRHAGVPAPNGCRITLDQIPLSLTFPTLLKPLTGAGSMGIGQVNSLDECQRHLQRHAISAWRCEPFYPGMAASVAVLCGPNQRMSLEPCRQHLSEDGTFSYLGGSAPLPASLATRARRLAESAVATLPEPLGYIGVDLVLGDAEDGSEDVVIEINPRLTTSYVGLRRLYATNLVQTMIDLAEGRRVTLSRRAERVEFASDGQVLADGPVAAESAPFSPFAAGDA